MGSAVVAKFRATGIHKSDLEENNRKKHIKGDNKMNEDLMAQQLEFYDQEVKGWQDKIKEIERKIEQSKWEKDGFEKAIALVKTHKRPEDYSKKPAPFGVNLLDRVIT